MDFSRRGWPLTTFTTMSPSTILESLEEEMVRTEDAIECYGYQLGHVVLADKLKAARLEAVYLAACKSRNELIVRIFMLKQGPHLHFDETWVKF